MSFVRNAWYVAAWSRDIGRTLARRTILGKNVVLFRRQDGAVGALSDRCPHRFLPLSMGKLIGDTIECGYHGLTFDNAGACIAAPGEAAIPHDARVASYPVRENMGMVWIWLGEASVAAKTPVYDLAQYHDPSWGVGHGDALHIAANYLLLCDNLCDPSHVAYVHPTTLGNPDSIGVPVEFTERPFGVNTTRWTMAGEPVGFFKMFGNFRGKVDRWQVYDMHAPSTAIIDFGSCEAGTGGPGGKRAGATQVYSCHFMTPETEFSTYDYWVHVRNFAAEDAGVSEGISDQFRLAFDEDKRILAAIQIEEGRQPGARKLGLALDGSAGLFRRKVAQQIRAEQPKQG